LSHVQADALVLFGKDTEFDLHVLHALAPSSTEYAPDPQSKHAASALAPTCIEYFPALQRTHAVAPVTPEYVPAGQELHFFRGGNTEHWLAHSQQYGHAPVHTHLSLLMFA
jgi:hypothetical protein